MAANNNRAESDFSSVPPWLWANTALLVIATLVLAGVYGQRLAGQQAELRQLQLGQHQTRERLLQLEDAININWLQTLNPLAKKVRGDIVWSSQKQQGIMRFANLPSLDDNLYYHLLIYDLNLSPDAPVSAAQFAPESDKAAELYIPFTTEQHIEKPYKFTVVLNKKRSDTPGQPLLLAQP